MKFDLETKFDVSSEVFLVVEIPMYNDYYRTETVFRVLSKERMLYTDPNMGDDTPLKVRKIRVDSDMRVNYLISNTWYDSSCVFGTYAEALKRCEELN